MARRRRKKGVSVSLFPFLSILACVIGTLTLMITALALGQMDTDEMASELRLDYLKRQIAKLQRENDLLARLVRKTVQRKTEVPRFHALVRVQTGSIQAVEEE